MSSSNSNPHPARRQTRSGSQRMALGVTEFLQAHDTLGALLPTIERLDALEKACATVLPVIFQACSVLNLESGQLVLAAPTAAFASKLKQQLPKLQNTLQQQGWQVNAIRIKVQVGKIYAKSITSKQIALSNHALSAFAALEDALEPSSRNADLKAALHAMVQRHRRA